MNVCYIPAPPASTFFGTDDRIIGLRCEKPMPVDECGNVDRQRQSDDTVQLLTHTLQIAGYFRPNFAFNALVTASGTRPEMSPPFLATSLTMVEDKYTHDKAGIKNTVST